MVTFEMLNKISIELENTSKPKKCLPRVGMPLYAGYNFISNPNLTETRILPQTRIQKILSWNPCNPIEWKYTTVTKPSKVTYQTKDTIIAHPIIINEIKKELMPV